MANTGKDNNNTRHVARRLHFSINGENCKMHNIEWCEGGLQLSYIAADSVGWNGLNPRMKYIMIRLEH